MKVWLEEDWIEKKKSNATTDGAPNEILRDGDGEGRI